MAIIPQDNINITDWKNTSLIEELKFNWSSNRCQEELFTDESWILLTTVFSSLGKFWVAQFLLLSMTFFSLSQNMFAILILRRVSRVDKTIRILLMIETTCKVIMCLGNVGKLPVFSCMAFPNRLSTYLDQLVGMEMAWCWIMSAIISTGNAGIQIFTMLYSLCRVRLLLENNPGRVFNKWKLFVPCSVGVFLVLLHFNYFLSASPYVHPFYRSCIMPQQPSFVYSMNRKVHDTKDKIWNLNLIQLFIYNYITFACHILIVVIIRRRAREIRQVQEGSEFKAQFDNYSHHVEIVGWVQIFVFHTYLVVVNIVKGQTNMFHAISITIVFLLNWGVLSPLIIIWSTSEFRNMGMSILRDTLGTLIRMLRGRGRVGDQEDTNHYIRQETRRGTIATVAERVTPLTPMIARASVNGDFTIKHNDLRPMGGDVTNVRSRAVTIRTGVLQNSYSGMAIRGGGIKPSQPEFRGVSAGSRQRTSSAVDSLRERRLFNDQGKTLKQIAVEAKSQVELLRLQNGDRWALKSCSESPDDRSISKATNETIADKDMEVEDIESIERKGKCPDGTKHRTGVKLENLAVRLFELRSCRAATLRDPVDFIEDFTASSFEEYQK